MREVLNPAHAACQENVMRKSGRRFRRLRRLCGFQVFTFGELSRQEESLDQFSLATDSHFREALVPVVLRYVGFGIQPLRKRLQLRSGNLAALDAIE